MKLETYEEFSVKAKAALEQAEQDNFGFRRIVLPINEHAALDMKVDCDPSLPREYEGDDEPPKHSETMLVFNDWDVVKCEVARTLPGYQGGGSVLAWSPPQIPGDGRHGKFEDSNIYAGSFCRSHDFTYDSGEQTAAAHSETVLKAAYELHVLAAKNTEHWDSPGKGQGHG